MAKFKIKPSGKVDELAIHFFVNPDGSLQVSWNEKSDIAIELGVNDWSIDQWLSFIHENT